MCLTSFEYFGNILEQAVTVTRKKAFALIIELDTAPDMPMVD